MKVDRCACACADSEPVKVSGSSSGLGCPFEEAEAVAHEHAQGVGHRQSGTNGIPSRAVQAVEEGRLVGAVREVHVDAQIDALLGERDACLLGLALDLHQGEASAGVLHSHVAEAILEGHQSRDVAILEAASVQGNAPRALRSEGALRQDVADHAQLGVSAPGCDSQVAGMRRKRPVGDVWIVVPLPFERERGAGKFIGGDDAAAHGVRREGGGEARGGLAAVEGWPGVRPAHREEPRGAAYAAVILEQVAHPAVFLGVHQASLRYALVAVDDLAFPRAREALAAMDDFCPRASGGPADVEDVVVAVDLVDLRPFRGQIDVRACGRGSVGDQRAVPTTGFQAREVSGELHDPDVAATVEDVIVPVVVEKKRGVVVHRVVGREELPRGRVNVLRSVEVGLVRGVGREEAVECSILVAQAACPGALAVGTLATREVQLVDVGHGLVHVACHLPVYEVGGLHHGNAWGHVHGGAAHVIGVGDSDDRDVGDIGPEERVLDRTRLRLDRSHSRKDERCGQQAVR